jgi:ABC-2 type transport system permease protein
MAVQAGSSPLSRAPSVPFRSRLYGFGSIYAKTLRDSRLALIVLSGLLGGLLLYAAIALNAAYSTLASRSELTSLVNDIPPALRGITGNPVNVGTIGGYFSWKYGPLYVISAGIWSILALSSTLAAEARRGSLDIVAASPFGKRRIAVEKLAAHVTGMTIVMAVVAVVAWASTNAFDHLPGDALPPSACVGFALWVGLIGLVSGSVAWALAPFVGRASSAGVAGAVLMGGYVVSGYAPSVPALAVPADLSWFYWTAGHVPLAGQYDWLSLVPVAIVTVVLFVVGIEAFGRRDLGSSSAIPVPAMPGALLGTRGPVRRSFGERLPLALAWGIGLAIYGGLIAASSRSFSTELNKTPDMVKLLHQVFPAYDVSSAGGFLQLMVGLGFIAVGLAAATLVSGWASDETDGRLELLLATPMVRARWAIAGGIGVFGAIAAMTAVTMAGIAFGVASAGGDIVTPAVGTLSLALYAAAAAGVGFAVGGLVRNSIAGEVTALAVIVSSLIDLFAPPLNLPDWFHELALNAHMGQPMVGHWDVPGVVACLALAAGGLLFGAWGLRRRDVGR